MAKFQKVAVVGAGAWGSALSIILSKNVENVTVWARETEVGQVKTDCTLRRSRAS